MRMTKQDAETGRQRGTFGGAFSPSAPARFWLGLVLAGAAALGVAALQAEEPSRPAATNVVSTPAGEPASESHKLGIGDRVSFKVVEDQEDAKPLFVTDSGELDVPYLGRVSAVGKTCEQLTVEIKAGLERRYYYQATVVLGVDLLNKSRGKVYLVGQLRAAGPQDIPSDEICTLSKAILRAGGFSDFADKRHVKVTRKTAGENAESRTFVTDVSEIWEKGRTDRDLTLEPGDTVFVPSRLVNF